MENKFDSIRHLSYVIKLATRLVLGLLLMIGLYLLAAAIGTLVPANTAHTQPRDGITIYITTNGFHTDVILPIQNHQDKCFGVVADEALQKRSAYRYISYGWGDKDFFMQSYNGNFPSFITVLDALLVPGESLMHVTFYRDPPAIDSSVKVMRVSSEQYTYLVQFVTDSFRRRGNELVRLRQPGYGSNDFFYEAEGSYHLFHTCNAWTGDALREAGVKVSWWTPLESSVFFYLPK